MSAAVRDRVASDAVIKAFLERTRGVASRDVRFVLFGSRARDDWRPDSDYDILVVVPHKDPELKSRLYDAVVDVLSETGRLVSLKFLDRATYERLAAIPTAFMANVAREGVPLG